MKLDISDGFYRIALNVDDIPKLGVAFPSPPGHKPLVPFPLVLPMGWKNSPPIFSAATETIADLTNLCIRSNIIPHHHHLNNAGEAIVSPNPAPCSTTPDVIPRDPSLPHTPTPLAYTDVYVDDFIAAAQGTTTQRQVRRLLLHAVDDIFRPLAPSDLPRDASQFPSKN
jgi:hypothetical protein